MASNMRTAPELIKQIDILRQELVKRFETIIDFATIDKTDRNTTAVIEFQMQVETAALIRYAEELQTLIRSLQEMWLFGQLKTVGTNGIEKKTDEDAREVAALLKQLLERRAAPPLPREDDMVTDT